MFDAFRNRMHEKKKNVKYLIKASVKVEEEEEEVWREYQHLIVFQVELTIAEMTDIPHSTHTHINCRKMFGIYEETFQ